MLYLKNLKIFFRKNHHKTIECYIGLNLFDVSLSGVFFYKDRKQVYHIAEDKFDGFVVLVDVSNAIGDVHKIASFFAEMIILQSEIEQFL